MLYGQVSLRNWRVFNTDCLINFDTRSSVSLERLKPMFRLTKVQQARQPDCTSAPVFKLGSNGQETFKNTTKPNDASSDILMGIREAFLFLFSLKQMQSMQSILKYNKLNIFCQVKTGYRIFSAIYGISDCDCALRFIGHFLQLTNLNSRLSSILRGWASLSSSSSTRTTNA